jgi:hypothetical protein
MILSFNKHGKGAGKGPVKYVCDSKKWDGTIRKTVPKILSGNAKQTEKLIDSIKNSWKYSSCVISFTKEEYTEELAKKVLEDFEKTAFVGLEKNQYEMLAVLHEDTENRHIHIIVPRVELTTQKSLNICPPGRWGQEYFKDWSIVCRVKFDLKQIKQKHDLDKSVLTKREKKYINKIELTKLSLTEQKLKIDGNIRENIANGLLANRQEVIDYLKNSGFEIARVTDKSISIKTATKNIRLESIIYDNTTTRNNTTYEQISRETTTNKHTNREVERRAIDEVKQRFEATFKYKFDYASKQYRQREQEDRSTYKKLLSYNEKAITNYEPVFVSNQLNSTNIEHSASSKIATPKFGNDLTSRIHSISARLATCSAQETLALNCELAELLIERSNALADTMKSSYKL